MPGVFLDIEDSALHRTKFLLSWSIHSNVGMEGGGQAAGNKQTNIQISNISLGICTTKISRVKDRVFRIVGAESF